jgi:hypothetical protein
MQILRQAADQHMQQQVVQSHSGTPLHNSAQACVMLS